MKAVLADSKLFLTLVLICLFLVLLDNLKVLYLPKLVLQTITSPIQFGMYSLGKSFASQFEFLTFSRKAWQEDKALKQQLGELLIENATLKSSLAESESLISQQNSLSPKTFDLLPARIIAFGRYLTIDRGLNDGLVMDQPVVYKENYVGQIKQLNPKTSQVVLVTDPDSKIAVYSQNLQGRARGILQGQFGSELLLDKILHQEVIEVGDLVYSEGTEGRLPRGLVMGKVGNVLIRQNEIFKQAKIDPVLKVTDLDIVFVVRN